LHTAACYSCLWNFQWFIVIIQIVCNGPGTCVIFCMAVYIQKLFCLNRTQIVYVESVARCNTLSLSGKLMYLFADKFIVQWPSLKEKYPKAIYLGRLVWYLCLIWLFIADFYRTLGSSIQSRGVSKDSI
jgi:hypothetical protein